MTQLTFGYSDSEDRIWLLFSDNGTQLWLTRRLTSILISHLANRMVITCPGGQMESSLKAETRVALEYEAAHERNFDADGLEAVPEPPPPPVTVGQGAVHHLTSVSITVHSERVKLEFMAPGFVRGLELTRAETHKLLGALARRSAASDWNLPNLPEWLVQSVTG